MELGINFTVVGVIMLFVILITIQVTLNRIYIILKEIKYLLKIKNN